MFSKSFFVIAIVATVALATPVKRASTTCDFIMTPSHDLGADELQTSINYAIGHAVGAAYEGKTLTSANSLVRHNDGTYDVHSIIEVTGVAPAEVGSTVESWDDTVLDGLYAQWNVGAANCY